METKQIRQVPYQHPDAQQLIAEVQQEYVRRYGGPDDTVIAHDEFSPPNGTFVLIYDGDQPVAMGGWRLIDASRTATELAGPAVEMKRMYVAPGHRGRGHARAILQHLEDTAVAAGAQWLILETGQRQPEAIELYRTAGYRPVAPFGHYADEPGSIHLGKRLTPVQGPGN